MPISSNTQDIIPLMDDGEHVVIAVCIGKAEPRGVNGELTAILKKQIQGSVRVTEHGLEGDTVCSDLHGDPDRAVYVMGSADLDWWRRELGQSLPPGTLGENLVITGLDSQSMHVGDKLVTANLELEVTIPRNPCATLAKHMDDRLFLRKFMVTRRPGYFCKVNQPGNITASEHIVYQPVTGDAPPILSLFKLVT